MSRARGGGMLLLRWFDPSGVWSLTDACLVIAVRPPCEGLGRPRQALIASRVHD